MELTQEQKEGIEVHVKAACIEIAHAFEKIGLAIAANSENKVDDIIAPVLAGPAKAALIDLIKGIKL